MSNITTPEVTNTTACSAPGQSHGVRSRLYDETQESGSSGDDSKSSAFLAEWRESNNLKKLQDTLGVIRTGVRSRPNGGSRILIECSHDDDDRKRKVTTHILQSWSKADSQGRMGPPGSSFEDDQTKIMVVHQHKDEMGVYEWQGASEDDQVLDEQTKECLRIDLTGDSIEFRTKVYFACRRADQFYSFLAAYDPSGGTTGEWLVFPPDDIFDSKEMNDEERGIILKNWNKAAREWQSLLMK